MTDLSVLPAELRKAARCWNGLLIHGIELKKHAGDCEYFVPAVLVVQDRQQEREEHLENLCEVLNNLEDDLQLDIPKGEKVAVSYEAAYFAIKKYTLNVLKKKIKEVEEAFS